MRATVPASVDDPGSNADRPADTPDPRTPKVRLRRPPVERFAGAERRVDLTMSFQALRAEAHDGADGHRQIAVFRQDPLRIVLFAFDPGGRLAAHSTPGYLTIHVIRGTIQVRTPTDRHEVGAGQVLILDPDVVHDVEAAEEADVVLTLAPVKPGTRGDGSEDE